MKVNGPPRLFLRCFCWFCHPKLRDSIEGDLMELYEERKVESGFEIYHRCITALQAGHH